MWADSRLQLERMHAAALVAWGAMSAVAGSVLWLVARRRGEGAEILRHFSVQMLAWGALGIALGGLEGSLISVRDHASAVRLERRVWFEAGFFAGVTVTGLVLGGLGWLTGRLRMVGAGVAVMVQGIALAILAITLGSQIAR